MKLDIISIGSATQDVFVHIPPKFLAQHAFTFKPGSKVEIGLMDSFTGGGATNTGVSFSRLGFKAGCFCAIGNDASGKAILDELRKEKVDASFAKKILGKKTSYSVILTGFGRDRVILFYNKAASLSDLKSVPKNLCAKWFYISSLHAKPLMLKQIAEQAEKCGAKIAFNPGAKELSLGISGIKKIFPNLEILLVNSEEALRLTGSADIKRNLKKLSEISRVVVITDGKNGAHATDGASAFYAPVYNVSVLDVTGAGDAFGSGFTSAIMKGKSIAEALSWGTANANSVIQYLGTKNILLKKNEIQEFAKKYSKGKKIVSEKI